MVIKVATLSSITINAIAQKLVEPIHVNGFVNESNEERRLAILFDDDTDLNNAISTVLFNKAYDEDELLSIEEANEVNLYQLFFKGIGESNSFLMKAH